VKQSHTAHVSSSARIYYPHLPYFGESIKVVRRCSKFTFGPDQVQVELSNGHQVVLPEWMLNEEVCRAMSIRERPLIEVQALLRLRSLLASQPFFAGRERAPSAVSCIPGGQVEPSKTKGVAVRRSKARAARSDPTALS
jgi:hypothetical protein